MALGLYKRKELGRQLTHNEIDINWDLIDAALSPAIEMVKFTTVAGQNDYSDPKIEGMTDALVVYGQLVLDEGTMMGGAQYSVSGDTITIDPGEAVQDGLRLLIIKNV